MTTADDDYLTDEYYFLEIFPTFCQANYRAKEIAKRFEGLVRVRREDDNFKILVPLWVKNEILNPRQPASPEREEPEDSQEHYDSIDDEFQREREELMNDIYGDREDWGRSTEEGWFYDDSDDA